MQSFLELAASRRSIRKFTEQDIPEQDIQYFIQAAVSAPSGCNSQCWNFRAVKSKTTIKQIEAAVLEKVEKILRQKQEPIPEEYLSAKKKAVTFFTKAPLVIVVFMTQAKFYDPVMIAALKEQGYDDPGIVDLFANYDILSIGAAIQNLLLAVHEKGYGACWMNEPALAGGEINQILGIPLEQRFISLIPVGIPEYTPREKPMKDLSQVFSLV